MSHPHLLVSLGLLALASAPSFGQSPSLPAAGCPQVMPTLGAQPSAQDLSDFNRWMTCLGPRLAASKAHALLLDGIETALEPLAAPKGALKKIKITTSLTHWEASSWSLTLDGGPSVQVAGYMPYSGLTTKAGVTAELVFEKPGFWKRLIPLLNLVKPFKFKKKKHEDKIVAVWVPSVKFPKWLLKFVSRNCLSDFSAWSPYRRTIALELLAPCLNKAKAAGAKGVIAVLDQSPPHAEKQYLPFSRRLYDPTGSGVPGIHVDRAQRKLLETHAASTSNTREVTLTLQGAVDPHATSDHLIYVLPGAHAKTASEEVVLLQTHTDGPGAVEENGVMALIALAHHYAAIPQKQRRRTLVFLFATGHLVKEIEGAKDLIWETPPDWLAKTRASVAIEHLGTKEWADSGTSGYGPLADPSGKTRDEPALVFVTGGKHPFEKLAADHLPAARRIVIPARRRLKWTFGREFFGEGQYISCTGVPTVGYVPNPNYMASYADQGGPSEYGHFEKLDKDRMLVELEAFRDLTQVLVSDPLAGWPSVTPDAERCEEPKNPCR